MRGDHGPEHRNVTCIHRPRMPGLQGRPSQTERCPQMTRGLVKRQTLPRGGESGKGSQILHFCQAAGDPEAASLRSC